MAEKSEAVKVLAGAIQTRAMAYFDIFEALAEEVGEKRASEIMKKGIYKRGKAHAKRYSKGARNGDIKALAKDFLKGGVNSLQVFGHEVIEAEKDRAVFRLNNCELVKGWQEGGLDQNEVAKMCDIAYAVDYGKFEDLGYNLEFSKRISHGDAFCEMIISRK